MLAWSHYLVLLRVAKPEARAFYEIEAARESWSVRELERQVAALLFERLAMNKNSRTHQAVNAELATLYWKLGEHISGKITNAEWGDGVVDDLATSLARRFPGIRGYTRRNLFRMCQFYEAYPHHEKVSALLTQLPWIRHLLILGQVKFLEARELYVFAAIRGRWSSCELERQIQSPSTCALHSLSGCRGSVDTLIRTMRRSEPFSAGALLRFERDLIPPVSAPWVSVLGQWVAAMQLKGGKRLNKQTAEMIALFHSGTSTLGGRENKGVMPKRADTGRTCGRRRPVRRA